MFQHFHAGDNVEFPRALIGQLLDCNIAILDLKCGFQQVHLRHFQRLFADIDAHHTGPCSRHGLGKNASTAADIKDALAFQSRYPIDIFQPQWIDIMQRLEFAVWIPPSVGQFAEFLQFDGIYVDHLVQRIFFTLSPQCAISILLPCA